MTKTRRTFPLTCHRQQDWPIDDDNDRLTCWWHKTCIERASERERERDMRHPWLYISFRLSRRALTTMMMIGRSFVTQSSEWWSWSIAQHMRLHITLQQTSRTLIIYHQSFSVCRNNNILTSRKQSNSGRMIYRRTMGNNVDDDDDDDDTKHDLSRQAKKNKRDVNEIMRNLNNQTKKKSISNESFLSRVIWHIISLIYFFQFFSSLSLSPVTIFDDKQVYTLTLTTMLDIYLAKWLLSLHLCICSFRWQRHALVLIDADKYIRIQASNLN